MIKFFKKIIKNMGNKEFVDYVMSYKADPYQIHFEDGGESYPDKNILLIRNDHSSHGLFAELRMTLNYLAFADRFHFTPYVRYNNNYLYYEEDNFLNTNNPFEYFFRQVSALDDDLVDDSRNLVIAQNAHGDMIESLNKECCSYEVSDAYIEEAARIVKTYIKFSDSVNVYLRETIQFVFQENESILGVHYRGTDFKSNYNNHPVAISLEDTVEETKRQMLEKKYKIIFLATDDQGAVNKFEEEFPGKVFYFKDICRGNTDVSVAFSKNTRQYHHYKLGLEVIRDMYTLSKCDGLIAGMSQVSTMARIFKRSYGEKYQNEIILNHGINKNRKYFSK